jgi:hypothetical protein
VYTVPPGRCGVHVVRVLYAEQRPVSNGYTREVELFDL